MDNYYLLELINETEERGGGLLLSYEDRPAVVVLSIDRYNQLLQGAVTATMVEEATLTALQEAFNLESKPMEKRKILVTGGAGFIGAHLVRRLLQSGYEVVVLDDLSSGMKSNIPDGATFIEGNCGDVSLLADIFASNKIYAVMHMAASIEVEESVSNPEKYFENNAVNTAKLLAAMSEARVKNIIFSSTAAVYGKQEKMPITEKDIPRPNNPYGASKFLAEKIIKYYSDFAGIQAIVLRYFNACGCDFDGSITATHTSHLIPIVLEVAKGKKAFVLVNGNDYETNDGTCIRDYVHVLDIADAHIAALEKIDSEEKFRVFNIGSGKGTSVKQIINTAAEVINKIIPMEIGPRRPGDAPATVADNSKLKNELGFELKYSDLETIISTSWKQINRE